MVKILEIGEFWEETILHKVYFKRDDYERWQEFRKFLFDTSLTIQRYFKEFYGWNHSDELLAEFGLKKLNGKVSEYLA